MKSSNAEQKKLGKKLATARKKLKLTQADVAGSVDLHVNYYARIERGEENPSLETLRLIAKLLKIKIEL